MEADHHQLSANYLYRACQNCLTKKNNKKRNLASQTQPLLLDKIWMSGLDIKTGTINKIWPRWQEASEWYLLVPLGLGFKTHWFRRPCSMFSPRFFFDMAPPLLVAAFLSFSLACLPRTMPRGICSLRPVRVGLIFGMFQSVLALTIAPPLPLALRGFSLACLLALTVPRGNFLLQAVPLGVSWCRGAAFRHASTCLEFSRNG